MKKRLRNAALFSAALSLAATLGLVASSPAQTVPEFSNGMVIGYGSWNAGSHPAGILVHNQYTGNIGVQVFKAPDNEVSQGGSPFNYAFERTLGNAVDIFGVDYYGLVGLMDAATHDPSDPEVYARDGVEDMILAYSPALRSIKGVEFEVVGDNWTIENTVTREIPAANQLSAKCQATDINPNTSWARGSIDFFADWHPSVPPAARESVGSDFKRDDVLVYSAPANAVMIVDNLADTGNDGIICGSLPNLSILQGGSVFPGDDYNGDGIGDLLVLKPVSSDPAALTTTLDLAVLFIEEDNGEIAVSDHREATVTIDDLALRTQPPFMRLASYNVDPGPGKDRYVALSGVVLPGQGRVWDRKILKLNIPITVSGNGQAAPPTRVLGDLEVEAISIGD